MCRVYAIYYGGVGKSGMSLNARCPNVDVAVWMLNICDHLSINVELALFTVFIELHNISWFCLYPILHLREIQDLLFVD